jgi:hypothetical protein
MREPDITVYPDEKKLFVGMIEELIPFKGDKLGRDS